ncbi:MAG: NUDIX hydrolase [Acidimicrobiales bacterium]
MTVPTSPRPAATVMLLRDELDHDVPRLEVLLLRRSGHTPFVPGAHVFPGGAVDAGDHLPQLLDHTDGLDDRSASSALDVDSGGMAFWVAAVRECLEEAGVLLATTRDGSPIGGDHPALTDLTVLRQRIERGDEHLAGVCAAHDLRLPLGAMAYVSRWVTPEESPRRYDTRFFAAPMPAGQRAEADDWEAVEAAWWHPADALAAWQADDIQLIEPTVVSLELLTGFETSAAALAALRGDDR